MPLLIPTTLEGWRLWWMELRESSLDFQRATAALLISQSMEIVEVEEVRSFYLKLGGMGPLHCTTEQVRGVLFCKGLDLRRAPGAYGAWFIRHRQNGCVCGYLELLGTKYDLKSLQETRERQDLSGSAAQGPYSVNLICSQCGQPWPERACGPTHAIIAQDIVRGTAVPFSNTRRLIK